MDDRIDIQELEAHFKSMTELQDSEEFFLEFAAYLRIITETPLLNTVAQKIFNVDRSSSSFAIASLYKALKRAWNDNYNGAEKIWSEIIGKMFLGLPTKYDVPLVFSQIKSVRPLIRIFHNQMLFGIATSRRMLFYESFDRDRAILRFAGQEITLAKKIGKENNPVRLLGTLVQDTGRFWFRDQILEDWEGIGWDGRHIPKNRVYHAAYNLNNVVATHTGVIDFLEHTVEKFRINPAYLKKA